MYSVSAEWMIEGTSGKKIHEFEMWVKEKGFSDT